MSVTTASIACHRPLEHEGASIPLHTVCEVDIAPYYWMALIAR